MQHRHQLSSSLHPSTDVRPSSDAPRVPRDGTLSPVSLPDGEVLCLYQASSGKRPLLAGSEASVLWNSMRKVSPPPTPRPSIPAYPVVPRLLRCGFHRCRKMCHDAATPCEDCDQICLKPRSICSHPCPSACHAPSACPIDLPCPKLIDVKCECGVLSQRARCATSSTRIEGNRERLIKCTESVFSSPSPGLSLT